MKAIVTNKEDPSVKVEYENPLNISVQHYINPDVGYDGSPVWVLELSSRYAEPGNPWPVASFKCSEWAIDII